MGLRLAALRAVRAPLLMLPNVVVFLIGAIGVYIRFIFTKYGSVACFNINTFVIHITLPVLAIKQNVSVSYGSGATTMGMEVKRNVQSPHVKCGWLTSHKWLNLMVRNVIDSCIKGGRPNSHTKLNPLFNPLTLTCFACNLHK